MKCVQRYWGQPLGHAKPRRAYHQSAHVRGQSFAAQVHDVRAKEGMAGDSSGVENYYGQQQRSPSSWVHVQRQHAPSSTGPEVPSSVTNTAASGVSSVSTPAEINDDDDGGGGGDVPHCCATVVPTLRALSFEQFRVMIFIHVLLTWASPPHHGGLTSKTRMTITNHQCAPIDEITVHGCSHYDNVNLPRRTCMQISHTSLRVRYHLYADGARRRN